MVVVLADSERDRSSWRRGYSESAAKRRNGWKEREEGYDLGTPVQVKGEILTRGE